MKGLSDKILEQYTITMDGFIISKKTGNPLKPYLNYNGYLKVNFYDETRKKINIYIHRLIAETFIPNPDGLPQVNHKDQNKLNNSVENLEWCTASHNIKSRSKVQKIPFEKQALIKTMHHQGMSLRSISAALQVNGVTTQQYLKRIDHR